MGKVDQVDRRGVQAAPDVQVAPNPHGLIDEAGHDRDPLGQAQDGRVH